MLKSKLKGGQKMNSLEILKYLNQLDIKQKDIASYLGITRQTVAKIQNGEYYQLKEPVKEKLSMLENRTKDEVEKIMLIDSKLDEIKKTIITGDLEYIDQAYEGISYMHYWITDSKFIEQPKYHKYYFGHMNNFYPRYNQAALFMRNTLNRRKYPLVTFQVDYKKNLITSACIKSFKPEFYKPEYNLSDVHFPIQIEAFIQLLNDRIKPKAKFLVYLDYLDDDWDYVIGKTRKKDQVQNEIYDLSRLLNFFENAQNYYGPLIEDALSQFKINYEKDKLLRDCYYRADKIVELINMISLDGLSEKVYDKSSYLFDSHGLKRENNYMKKERRKLKGE